MMTLTVFDQLDEIRQKIQAMRERGCSAEDVRRWLAPRARRDLACAQALAYLEHAADPALWLDRFVAEMG